MDKVFYMDKVFDRFMQNAENIRETWQIVEFFEDELKKFKDEMSGYESSVLREQELLKKIRGEYASIQESLQSAKDEFKQLKEQNDTLKENIHAKDSIDNLRKNVAISPLEKVNIRLKDGIVVKANPANEVYSQEVLDKYIMSLGEIKGLRTKLMSAELENAKLRNEINNIKNKMI